MKKIVFISILTISILMFNDLIKNERELKMFEVTKIENYDTHHRYGTDWHTDYHIKTDEEHTTETLFTRLKNLGYSPYGQIDSEKTKDGYIYKTVMY